MYLGQYNKEKRISNTLSSRYFIIRCILVEAGQNSYYFCPNYNFILTAGFKFENDFPIKINYHANEHITTAIYRQNDYSFN